MIRIPLKSLAFALLLPLPALALLSRADRDDEEYVELATAYPSAVALGLAQGEGALVAPTWVLTAAHRAAVLRDVRPRPTLRIMGGEHAIARIVVHPGWNGGCDNDLALVELDGPVAAVAPAALHRARDEAGKGVVVVAHGASGKAGAVPPFGKRRARAAINTISAVHAASFVVMVKAGDARSDLQGALLREETGAPAYIDAAEGTTLAGILCAVEEPGADAPSGSPGERETFTRVSAYAPWIDATIRATGGGPRSK
jgi:secreted trypsin-like serine protease